MHVFVFNGKEIPLVPGQTIQLLLSARQDGGTGVAIMRNGVHVPREAYRTTEIQVGDVIECVSMMQGG